MFQNVTIDNMGIGIRLKELRREKGLTQCEFAQALHVSRSAITLYETERRDLPNNLIREIAVYFNVSTDYLFGLED